MAQCEQCGSTIIFGGHRLGDHRFCSARCTVQGRQMLLAEARVDDDDSMREDMLVVLEELQQQRLQLAELHERVDFLERALAQLRSTRPGGS